MAALARVLASARSALATSLAWTLPLMISALATSWAITDLGKREYSLDVSIAIGTIWLLVSLIVLLFVGLWRLFRVVRPIRPYRSRTGRASFLKALFQVQGLMVTLAVGSAIAAWWEPEVERRLLTTPLETLIDPVSLLGALSVALVLFLPLRRVPYQLLVLRLKGKVSAPVVNEIIVLIAGIGPIWIIQGPSDRLDVFANFVGVTIAAILGYALPRLWLTRPRSHFVPGLWLVLTHPSTLRDWPKLVDRLSRGRRTGPMVLVSPPDAVPLGGHLYLADRLGMLDSLFPRLEIEVSDWQRVLPPADRWAGVVYRQIHPPVALMPTVLDSYLGPLDQVLLIASCEDDVKIWRGRLPTDRTRVLWVSTPGETQAAACPDRVAGYHTIAMDATSRKRINMQGWFSAQDTQVMPDEVTEALFEDREKYRGQEVAR